MRSLSTSQRMTVRRRGECIKWGKVFILDVLLTVPVKGWPQTAEVSAPKGEAGVHTGRDLAEATSQWTSARCISECAELM